MMRNAINQAIAAITPLWKRDRILLVIYVIALFGLLLLPIDGPGYSLLGIEIDKWTHAALFAGLAMLLRWNLSTTVNAVILSIGVAAIVAGSTELAQDLVAYRSSDFGDALAGTVGAAFGALAMNRVMSSCVPDRLVGLAVVALGIMISVIFLLADMIGISTNNSFGTTQIVGTALGVFITVGGARVYLNSSNVQLRPGGPDNR